MQKPKMVGTEFLNKTPIAREITNDSSLRRGESVRCYYSQVANKKNVWQDYSPLLKAVPTFIVQLIIITAFAHCFVVILKPIRQPLIVSKIWAGLLLGTTGLLRFQNQSDFLGAIFSISRMMLLETVGNLGLVYALFLHGLEIDITTLPHINKRSYTYAIVGALVPFAIGSCLYYLCVPQSSYYKLGSVFWGVSLSHTGLFVISESLANLKLLHTDIGKTAMSSALINHLLTWILLVVALACAANGKLAMISLGTTTLFIFLCFYIIRPCILWLIRHTSEGDEYSDATISIILTGVLLCGLVTDMLGMTSMVGAFLFGLVIPNELLGNKFLIVIQGFVNDILMPIYFMLMGIRTSADVLFKAPTNLFKVGVVICLCCLTKFGVTFAVSHLFGLPHRQGVTLGVLMNTKGLLAIISIFAAHDELAIDDTGFVIMLIAIVIMIMVTEPAVSYLYRPSKRSLSSKHMSLQKHKQDSELRILACAHQIHTVAGTVNLLRISNASKRSPIFVYALQLIEYTQSATAMLVLNLPVRTNSSSSRHSTSANAQTEQIIDAFDDLMNESFDQFTVLPLTAMSGYSTMHEDICYLAEEKGVTLIILPFHGKSEEANAAYKHVNNNVLANASCSVAMLIDRGIGMAMHINYGGEGSRKFHIAMIYIGGPDDREALSYALRMGGHANTTLTIIRVLPGENADHDQQVMEFGEENDGVLSVIFDAAAEKYLDDMFINNKKNVIETKESISYVERTSNNGAETVEIIKSMGGHFDVYVIGRGIGRFSPLTSGLADWSECPEVGAIGDILVSSDFSLTSSVLVVQQYAGATEAGMDGTATPDNYNENFGDSDRTTAKPSARKREMDV